MMIRTANLANHYQGERDAQLTAAPPSKRNPAPSSLQSAGRHPSDAGSQESLPVRRAALRIKLHWAANFPRRSKQRDLRGCHGSDARGSPIGADLTSGTWLWSDGSLAGSPRAFSRAS